MRTALPIAVVAGLLAVASVGCDSDDDAPSVTFGSSAPADDDAAEAPQEPETDDDDDVREATKGEEAVDHRLPDAPQDGPTAAPDEHIEERHMAELPPGTDSQQSTLNDGRIAFLNDEYTAAEEVFEELAFDEPITSDTVSAAVALGQIYIETGRPEAALELFDELQDHVRDIPEVLLIIARTYESLGESERALHAYDRAYEQKRDYIFILPEMAKLLVEQDRQEEAGELFWRYEEYIEELVGHLGDIDDTTEEERVYIADIFALLSDERAHDALEASVDDDPSERVRVQAAIALGEGVAFDARETLENAATEDSSEAVRRAARRALDTLRDFEEQFDDQP